MLLQMEYLCCIFILHWKKKNVNSLIIEGIPMHCIQYLRFIYSRLNFGFSLILRSSLYYCLEELEENKMNKK